MTKYFRTTYMVRAAVRLGDGWQWIEGLIKRPADIDGWLIKIRITKGVVPHFVMLYRYVAPNITKRDAYTLIDRMENKLCNTSAGMRYYRKIVASHSDGIKWIRRPKQD